jgi:hypothetical protein
MSAACMGQGGAQAGPCCMSDTGGDGGRAGPAWRAVSSCSSGTVSASSPVQIRRHTRHTTTAQRWHSPTMSRAHLPMRPLVILRADDRLNWASLGAPAASSLSLPQCSVCLTSWPRYSSRFARNCRHVRDRSCSVFRSSSPASWRTMLCGSRGQHASRRGVKSLLRFRLTDNSSERR